jgi:hypothetical protein
MYDYSVSYTLLQIIERREEVPQRSQREPATAAVSTVRHVLVSLQSLNTSVDLIKMFRHFFSLVMLCHV